MLILILINYYNYNTYYALNSRLFDGLLIIVDKSTIKRPKQFSLEFMSESVTRKDLGSTRAQGD